MKRRDLLKAAACVPLAGGVSRLAKAQGSAVSTQPAGTGLSDLDTYNYIIGTQAIGATYQFTKESLLVETARVVLDMGSNMFKFTLGRDYRRMMLKPGKAAYPETMQYLLNQGRDAINSPRIRFPGASADPPPADPAIRSLVDLVQLEPSFRQVLDMPFAYYFAWTYAFSPAWWHQGFPPAEQAREYEEVRSLAAFLLRTYSGTGKTFFIGHWEGDWHLRPDLKTDSDPATLDLALQGMTDWLNIRQKAIDDARRDTPHKRVQVYHYTEVNHVTTVSMAGRPSVCNRVLPRTHVDYVSYSTYDSLGDIPGALPRALDYIEARLPARPAIEGKRVFIGEYGFPARRVPEAERDRRSREVMRVGLQWGCPFILSWQMYNNEFAEGAENGYWLIDDRGVRQPLWHTHHTFCRHARAYVAEFKAAHDRLPSAAEFRRFALDHFA